MPRILNLSPVHLRGEHLPADIAALLNGYSEAKAAANNLYSRIERCGSKMHPDHGPLVEEYEAALPALEAAHKLLADATRRQGRAIIDSAAGSFASHVEDARRLLAEAEQQMRLAAAAAGLFATAVARPGKPVLDSTGSAAHNSRGRVRSMNNVSAIKEALAGLVEDVD